MCWQCTITMYWTDSIFIILYSPSLYSMEECIKVASTRVLPSVGDLRVVAAA